MAQVAPPAEARVGPARPGGLKSGLKSGMKSKPAAMEPDMAAPELPVKGGGAGGEAVAIPKEAFIAILQQIRTNELLGAAAADALEVAAGLKEPEQIVEQSPKAAAVRKKVAGCRMGAAEEIPDAPTPPPPEPEAPAKKRASLSAEAMVDAPDMEEHEAGPKDAPEPPELNLNVKQNKLRTDLEMWVMDAIPELYGVDDSEELSEELQEDGQADKISFAIAETDPDKMKAIIVDWIKSPPDGETAVAFIEEYCGKVREIQDAGAKKKKKKKAAEAEA